LQQAITRQRPFLQVVILTDPDDRGRWNSFVGRIVAKAAASLRSGIVHGDGHAYGSVWNPSRRCFPDDAGREHGELQGPSVAVVIDVKVPLSRLGVPDRPVPVFDEAA